MAKQFPLIKVSGSYADIGHAIGKTMAFQIKKSLTDHKKEIPDYSDYLEKSKKYFDYTNTIFPQYISELEAICESAGVDKYDYFFSNNREVYDVAEKYDAQSAVTHDHCTIAVSFNGHGAVVGHNEDWHISALDSLYLLKATINEITFFSLNYAGAIPGVSAAINNFGLVQCINDLYQTNQFGVPKNFLARAILECNNINDAEKLIKNIRRASGFNHVLVQGESGLNIEIAGDKISTQQFDTNYVHTNHYLSSELRDSEKFHTVSSEARLFRASELIKPGMTVAQMQSLLSDTQNRKNPICRGNETIASIVFDTSAKEVYISHGHPCSNPYQLYKPF
jgi:predicted choloylglycine hydrolase